MNVPPNASELDRISYKLYLDEMWEQQIYTSYNDYWLTFEGFMASDREKYYEQANIIIRRRKIDNIKNGI